MTFAFGDGPVRAAAPAVIPAPAVPLHENFSKVELVTIGTVAVAGILALAAAPKVVGPAEPSIGPPAAGSFDRRVSDALYLADGGDGRFLGRVPDIAGLYVLPYLPALFYGGQTLWLSRTGHPAFSEGDLNPHHRLAAFAEALGWTALFTGVTKVVVGRARPYLVLDHPELAAAARSEDNLSFFSSHSAAVFCAASFFARDISDALRWRVLAGWNHRPFARFLLASLTPYLVGYSVASLVGVSRIVDQQHWATDVLVGATVGSLTAHLTYVVHFDHRGQPRRRLAGDSPGVPLPRASFGLVPTPNGLYLAGLLP